MRLTGTENSISDPHVCQILSENTECIFRWNKRIDGQTDIFIIIHSYYERNVMWR